MWIKKIFKGIVLLTVGLAVFGYIVMLLWNALVPELFKGPYITFWQSAGLLLLSHILLHACPLSRGGPGKWKRAHWRKHWEQKIANMSPEEREKFKAEWKNRCGWSSGWSGDWQQYMGYATMTPEEKEKFKEDMKRRWGGTPEGEQK